MKMKKAIILLLAAVLLLTGCDLSAGSAESQSPNIPTKEWTEYPFLSLVPKLPGSWGLLTSERHHTSVYSTNMGYEDLQKYVQSVKDAGFSINSFLQRSGTSSKIEDLSFNFRAQDTEGNYVYIYYGLLNFADANYPQPTCWLGVGNYSYAEGYQTPGTVLPKAEEAWDRSPTRALLPAPPTENWQKGKGGVILLDMSLEDMFSYRKAIRQAGFNINAVEKDDYTSNDYSYFACNADGYGVNLQRLYSSRTETLYFSLVIYPPIKLPDAIQTWEGTLPKDVPLPEPESFPWHIICQPYDFFTIQLPGMGYEDAVAYMKAIDTYLKNNGQQEAALLASVENDPQNQTLSYGIRIFKGAEIQYTLTYDPSRTDCPCIIQLHPLDNVYE